MAEFRHNVDDLVRCLHRISQGRYSVKEVIKGGSLGKGTATEDSDIDLIVFFNGVESIRDLMGKRDVLFRLIKTELDRGLSDDEISWQPGTVWAVKCKLRGIDVDILPAFDVVSALGSPARVYDEMKTFRGGTEKAAQEYSASLATLQRDFVKKAESRVKEVIRRLKSWNEGIGEPVNSYSLELLAIHVNEVNRITDIDKLMSKCMEELVNIRKFRIAFNAYYNSSQYSKTAPCILDPANPYRNILERVRDQNLSKISDEARKYLRNH